MSWSHEGSLSQPPGVFLNAVAVAVLQQERFANDQVIFFSIRSDVKFEHVRVRVIFHLPAKIDTFVHGYGLSEQSDLNWLHKWLDELSETSVRYYSGIDEIRTTEAPIACGIVLSSNREPLAYSTPAAHTSRGL